WLGVADDFVPPNLSSRENATPDKVARRGGLLDRVRHSGLWNALGGFAPPALRRFGRRLLEKRVDRSADAVAETQEYLRPIQFEQVNELRELLGRDFPDWPSSRPCAGAVAPAASL